MANFKKKADGIKTKLFRLHFLLTEPESPENQNDGINQFKLCFKEILGFLTSFLEEEWNISPKSDLEILNTSFEKKLFTEEMTHSLKEMQQDFINLKFKKKKDEIYIRIKSIHAHHLQVIYDMLVRMGEDIEDEEL